MGYGIGGRYQVIPEMLSISMDLGICTYDRWPDHQQGSFGLVPGVQFSTNFTDEISFGAGMGLGFEFDALNGKPDNERGLIMNLSLGAEIDFELSENVTLWVGADYTYDRLNYEDRADNELKDALTPMIGAVFSSGNISVGTTLGLRLNATNRLDGEPKDATGLWGGVDFAVKF
jgi:hypothetical protein